MSESGWIGVDLDGTLAHYEGWKGVEHIGHPIPDMVDRVKAWIVDGKKVKIFTARCYRRVEALLIPDGEEYDNIRQSAWNEANKVDKVIWRWLKEQGLPRLDITCTKDFDMIALYDDRCVQVETNTGKLISVN